MLTIGRRAIILQQMKLERLLIEQDANCLPKLKRKFSTKYSMEIKDETYLTPQVNLSGQATISVGLV